MLAVVVVSNFQLINEQVLIIRKWSAKHIKPYYQNWTLFIHLNDKFQKLDRHEH